MAVCSSRQERGTAPARTCVEGNELSLLCEGGSLAGRCLSRFRVAFVFVVSTEDLCVCCSYGTRYTK